MADALVWSGLKVLIVEDEAAIGIMIEDMLTDLGCVVVGPAGDLTEAVALAANAPLDVAIVDVNLGGRDSEPVAKELAARNIPFIFATGYGRAAIGSAYSDAITLRKPFMRRDLIRALEQAVGRAGGTNAKDGERKQPG